jgi:AcrR family transcriptional regulator
LERALAHGGRPRDPGNDDAILGATLHLMSRDGYARTSLQAVANEAGVSKATIHLRWRTKADLARAAMEYARLADLPALVGDTRKDLIAQLHWTDDPVEQFSAMGIRGVCLAEETTTPELLELFRERGAVPRLQNLITILDAARGRREIDEDADVETAARLLYGEYFAAYIPGEAPDDLVERSVDLVLRGLGYSSHGHSGSKASSTRGNLVSRSSPRTKAKGTRRKARTTK